MEILRITLIPAATCLMLGGCAGRSPQSPAQTHPSQNIHAARIARDLAMADGAYAAKKLHAALHWDRQAADLGSAKAQLRLGLLYLNRASTKPFKRRTDGNAEAKKAATWIMKAAKAGDPSAELELGELYRTGEGLAPNTSKAIHWWKVVLHEGNASNTGCAELQIGLVYDIGGAGVPRNYKRAVRWEREAASTRGTCTRNAMMVLGLLYEHGHGVTANPSLAYTDLAIGYARDPKAAHTALRGLARKLSAKQLAEAKSRAAAWRPGDPPPSPTSGRSSAHSNRAPPSATNAAG